MRQKVTLTIEFDPVAVTVPESWDWSELIDADGVTCAVTGFRGSTVVPVIEDEQEAGK